MRAILNAILTFIGEPSLTDEEFDDITLENTSDDYLNYLCLANILEIRETVSVSQDRLKYYFMAKGLSLTGVETGKSDIFLGGPICE